MTNTARPSKNSWRTRFLTGALLFFGFAPALSAAPAPGDSGASVSGIARVIDGDTLDIDGQRIRLEGIDAPEAAQSCQTATGASWPCGRAAISALRKFTDSNAVTCDSRGHDKYDRLLAICFVNGRNINEAMVQDGYAWAFVKYSSEFTTVEAAARAAKTGIWQGPAEAPWDYRHKEWQVAESTAPAGCAIKGNISDGGHIYHVPWGIWYDKVRIDLSHGERWFCSESEALAAGWRPASSH